MIVRTNIVKNLDITEVIRCVLGSYRPMFFSKRLAPAMTVCNGRIFVGKELVMEGDIDIYRYRKHLRLVADMFGVVLELKSEHYEQVLWKSSHENEWFGYCVDEKETKLDAPQCFSAVFPWYEKRAKEQQKQWGLDHGIIKRRKKSKAKVKKKSVKK